MLKKKQNKPIPFNHGICSIYTVDKRTLKVNLGTFNYREETVGIKAFTDLQVIGVVIDKVISIPFNTLVDYGRVVVIGDDVYKISLIQLKDTFPKSLRLTLTKNNLRWQDD